MPTQKIVLFYGGFLGQWYPCRFVWNGISFNCAEQAMMYSKASYFGDNARAELIMKESHPGIQKAYGRKVHPFDAEKWKSVAEGFVYDLNVAKFSQNLDLRKLLIKTENAILAEASPDDLIWGIGFSEDDPRAKSSSLWKGQNLLGKVLMDVREFVS